MAISNFYRMDGWVKTTLGPAVSGAQIYVCTQPANVFPPTTPPNTTPVPWGGPTPQAQIYSDAGITKITQPILTDGFGHYDFYVAPGLYTVVVLYNGTVQQFYVDQSIGNVGSSAGSSVLFETNGTPNFNQLVQNLVQGSGITISTDNLGNTTISASAVSSVTLQTNGVNNGSQTILNLAAGANMSLADNGTGTVTITGPTGLPASANLGDTLRWNVYGDNTWDTAIAVPRFCQMIASDFSTTAVMLGTGIGGTLSAVGGTVALQNATATESNSYIFNTISTATTNATVRMYWKNVGSTGQSSLGSFLRLAWRVRTETTNGRYWIGLANLTIANEFVSDTPNQQYVAFRFSNGVDTHWVACVGTSSVNQSTHDTGISLNTTNSMLFEIVPYSGGVLFYINGAQVANLTTNVPASTTFVNPIVSADNKNSAVSTNMSFWYSTLAQR